MRDEYNPILDFIDKARLLLTKYYTEITLLQLKKESTLKIIYEIMIKTHKMPSEAVLILFAAIKYIHNDVYAISKLQENNLFENFIKENAENIIEIAVNKNVQGNLPERGLPILEILSQKLQGEHIAIVELGASYGLIGNCLLNFEILTENNMYFQSGQKMPRSMQGIECYLGIDIDPPDKEWLLACCPDPENALQRRKFIDFIETQKIINVLKASAFGFSKLNEIVDIVKNNYKIVVLTSFMLYQLDEKNQKLLKDEIVEFAKVNNGHWISQDVKLVGNEVNYEYYVEWDGTRIMQLEDDSCRSWEWIN